MSAFTWGFSIGVFFAVALSAVWLGACRKWQQAASAWEHSTYLYKGQAEMWHERYQAEARRP